MTLPARPFPKPPAQVAPHVAIPGPELALELVLQFVGAEIYVPDNPEGRSRIEALVATSETRELAQSTYVLQRRVPLAIPWVAACLHHRGWPVNEIARRLRISDVTARRYVARYNTRQDAP